MIHTVSEILLFQLCPSLWAYKYVAQRVPTRAPSTALDRGIALHEVLRRVFTDAQAPANTTGWEAMLIHAYHKEVLARGTEPGEKQEDELGVLAHGLSAYWRTAAPEGETIACEKTLIAEAHTHQIAGRLDRLKRADGGLWHVQYKSFSQVKKADGNFTNDAAAYITVIARSLHEITYRRLIETHYPGEKYMGTELVLFGLDPLHAREAGTSCTHCGKNGYRWRGPTVHIEPLRIRDAVVTRRDRDLLKVFMDIEAATQTCIDARWPMIGGPPPLEQRENACFFKGRLCGYLPICDEQLGVDISDRLLYTFADPLERYGDDLLGETET